MKLQRKQAFTLIEILLTTVIVGMSLVAIASCFSNGLVLTTIIEENSIVTCALQEQIEIIRGQSFNDVFTNYFPVSNFNSPALASLSNPTGTISVDYPMGGVPPNNEIIRVTVAVTWTSAKGRVKTKSTATLITSGGLEG